MFRSQWIIIRELECLYMKLLDSSYLCCDVKSVVAACSDSVGYVVLDWSGRCLKKKSESGDIWLVPLYPVALQHVLGVAFFPNTSLWKLIFIFWRQILCQPSVCCIFLPLVLVEGQFYEPCSVHIWSTILTVILSYMYRIFCSYTFFLPTLPDLDFFRFSSRFFLSQVFSSKLIFSYSFSFSFWHYFLSS